MKCPYCGHTDDRVIDSRPSRDESSVRRRRECTNCQKRFTTYEYVEEIPLQVVKRDGTVEEYNRNKLMGGLRLSAVKRSITQDDLDELVRDVEKELYSEASKEVSSQRIGELVMVYLRKLDEVAFIRYASVYRRFEDAGEFMREVRKLT